MKQHTMFVIAALGLGACTSKATDVEIGVSADQTLDLTGYQIQIGNQSALVDAVPIVDVDVPDAMAGHPGTVEVWGLVDGNQVAYGSVAVSPLLHASVSAIVVLTDLACGTGCTFGATACSPGGVVTCAEQADGCVDWSAPIACPSDTPACSNGACAPAVTCAQSGVACDDGDGCTEHDTCEDGTCSGTAVTCDTPLAPTCMSSSILRTYKASGVCANGACTYSYTDKSCSAGCSQGACLPDVCTCDDAMTCCNAIGQDSCEFNACDGPSDAALYVHANCPWMTCE